jgi:hypothetical protein
MQHNYRSLPKSPKVLETYDGLCKKKAYHGVGLVVPETVVRTRLDRWSASGDEEARRVNHLCLLQQLADVGIFQMINLHSDHLLMCLLAVC